MSRTLMLYVFVLCCPGISMRADAQQISQAYRKGFAQKVEIELREDFQRWIPSPSPR